MQRPAKKYPLKFVGIFLTLFLVFFILENINHRFWLNDFKVYYMAGQALLDGSPVYGVLFALGSGYFKYSPFTAMLVLPFCVFDYGVAAIFQYALLSFTITALFMLAGSMIQDNFFNKERKSQEVILLAALACTANHLLRELHLGNINVLLLFLVCVSLCLQLNGKYFLSALSLALVLITKPFFGLLVLPFLLRGNYKVLSGIFFSTLAFVFLPSMITGFTGNINLHKEWIKTIVEHNSGFPSFNTFAYIWSKYTHGNSPEHIQMIILLIVVSAYLLLHFYLKSVEKQDAPLKDLRNADFLFESFLLVSLLPNLFKTDTQHFLLTLPLILMLLFYLFSTKNYLLIAIFSFLILVYGWNISAIFGKKLSTAMDEYGFLGLSNIALILLATFIYIQKIRPQLKEAVRKINS